MRAKKSRFVKKDALTGFLFVLPALFGTFAFFLIPFVINLFNSLFDTAGRFNLFGNYVEIIQTGTFQLAAWNTLKFILVAVPLIIVVSLAIALLLHKKLKGHNFFRTIFVFPLVLPIASVILFFEIILTETGVLNSFLTSLGFSAVDWLNSPESFYVLVFLYIWKNCGYNIVLFLAALNSVSKDYYEVMRMESDSGWKRLRYVTLPFIVPHLFFIFVISIVNSFKVFREAFILFGAYPNQNIYMLQHYINNNFSTLNYTRLSVATILIFILISLLVLFAFKMRNKFGEIE